MCLNEMASEVNLSPSRLRHMFKSETGNTPTQHRLFLRMDKARRLLETTSMSIKEIAASVGMSSSSHLARCFQQRFEMSPTNYRTRYRYRQLLCNEKSSSDGRVATS